MKENSFFLNVLSISILAALIISMLVFNHRYSGSHYVVAGMSMTPAFRPGEKIRVDRSVSAPLRTGDIVALSFKRQGRPMLKRVIATEGDEVIFVDGQIKVNGRYLEAGWWPRQKRLSSRHYRLLALQLSRYENRVPQNSLIVMGDNTENSFDSGDYGFVSRNQVIGRINR